MKKIYCLLFCLLVFIPLVAIDIPKVLHLSFHKGCIKDFEYVAQQLSLDLTSIFIPDKPQGWLDGKTAGNGIYNIGHDRARNAWLQHKDFFEQFDVILTSDTAPLARIFLQNGWQKPLIIWVCNRFDYADTASLDCHFPDPEYYRLFHEATRKKNIRIASYTAFEHIYARSKGVEIGRLVIKPCAEPNNFINSSSIPQNIVKNKTFFIPPYENDTRFLTDMCRVLKIPAYHGRYNGPGDLKDFKAIIHLPYAWSNLAFFENMQNGIVYFIPSRQFILQLMRQGNYWFCNAEHFPRFLQASEWYCDEYKDIITYFDSWTDLVEKIRTTDLGSLRSKILDRAKIHHDTMIMRWRKVFNELLNNKQKEGL